MEAVQNESEVFRFSASILKPGK